MSKAEEEVDIQEEEQVVVVDLRMVEEVVDLRMVEEVVGEVHMGDVGE